MHTPRVGAAGASTKIAPLPPPSHRRCLSHIHSFGRRSRRTVRQSAASAASAASAPARDAAPPPPPPPPSPPAMSTSARRRLLRDFKRCVCPLFFRAGSGAERECSCGRSVVGRASGLQRPSALWSGGPPLGGPPLPFPPVPVPPRPLLVRLLVLAGHLDSICHGCASPPL